MCFFHHFVLAKLATSNIRVKLALCTEVDLFDVIGLHKNLIILMIFTKQKVSEGKYLKRIYLPEVFCLLFVILSRPNCICCITVHGAWHM